jgi:hypothetical protein
MFGGWRCRTARAPTTESYAYYNSAVGAYVIMGGTPAGIGRAQRAEDQATRAFLTAVFGPPN